MNEDAFSNSPTGWSSLNFSSQQTNQSQFSSPMSLYRTSSNMSIKSNATLNSFYNVNTASLTLKQNSSVLPYRVIEALSASNLKNLTARISDSGWAWLVSGRRLYVWRYLEDCSAIIGKPKASKCYQLLLPPSDIAHKAELICVLSSFEQKNKFPSALAVSPEGAIRYWPNISQESNVIDSIVTADLQGQECLSLIDIQPLGCLLGTTTSSLVHICLDTNQADLGTALILCRTLKTPQGILSGIGRRVSSFIFGSLPTTHQSDSKQLIRIVRNHVQDDTDEVLPLFIFSLSNCIIQKWEIDDNDSENLLAEIDLERYIKEAFISKLWNRTTTHHNQLTLWPLDLAMKLSNEVVLLVMCNNSDIANDNYFALFTLNNTIFTSTTDGSLSSQQQSELSSIFKSFRIIPNIALLDGNDPLPNDSNSGSLLSTQHRHLSILSGTADDHQACYIYNSSKIYRINHSEDENDIIDQEIDFQLSDDYLLGVVAVNQSPLLFTFKKGFVSIHLNQPDSISSKQLSAVDREFITSNNTDKFSVLKRALHLFAKGEKARSGLMVKELFPWIASNQRPTSNVELDDVVCAVSADICDQIPHQDPRWAHASISDGMNVDGAFSGEESNSINYVIITNQLEDKLMTHRLFIELLQSTGAWDALTSLTTSLSILPSKLVLCEHTEKLIVSLNLRKQHIKFGKILEAAIRKVLEKRNIVLLLRAHLTPQDLFYREVTKIDDLFWSLIELESETLSQDQSNSKTSQSVILPITDIITSVFSEVCLYRQANGAIYQSAAVADCDYVPWSSVEHVSGVRETLLKQFDLLIKCSAIDQNTYIAANEECKYNLIGQKIVDLSDIILDSYASQLSCLSASNEKYSVLKSAFQSNRFNCLMPLLRLKQYERAASLAEKYEDFDILIKICEELNNQEQLQQYVQQFANKGFSEHLFEWYLKEGKQGKMLSTVSNNYKLADFLSNHESLNWLHQIHLSQFKEASSTLNKLAVLEENYPGRRKTLLSMGKLSLIASQNCDYSGFDDQIKFINFQENLSETLLRKRSLDRNTLKVLAPEQLIDILTSGVEGPNEDIDNFKRALEIAELIEKHLSLQTYREVILKIWRRAFLKDDWGSFNTDNYEVPIKQSFFYQLTIAKFGNEPKKLPLFQDLTDNFEEVTNEKTSFFLRATYELILH